MVPPNYPDDATRFSNAVVTDLEVEGELTFPLGGGVIQSKEAQFVENGAGTYTATLVQPAGSTLIDIIIHATVLWTAGTSAALNVGDTDADGFYAAVNLKATDLILGESLSFAKAGGKEGVYITATHVIGRYSATARDIIGVVVSVGSGTAGRTRMTLVYSLPPSVITATKA